jgi:hypothetical protein
MEQNQSNRHELYKSIWFWWFVLSLGFTVGGIGTLDKGFSAANASTTSYFLESLSDFFGLFIPANTSVVALIFRVLPGLASSVVEPQNLLILVYLLIPFLLMYFSNKLLNKYDLKLYQRIALNFLVLLVITVITDLIVYRQLFSWAFLISNN